MADIMSVCQAGNVKAQIVSRSGGFVKQISLWIVCETFSFPAAAALLVLLTSLSPASQRGQKEQGFFEGFRFRFPDAVNICRGQICSGRGTQKPQRSTKLSLNALINSIKSTYFNRISTGFHEPFHLLWEQRVEGSNPSAPTIIINNIAYTDTKNDTNLARLFL
jgi:hypothetical protein